jgi:hypothetical protein
MTKLTGPMSPAHLVPMRLAAQRISSTTFERPSEAVAWLGAIQAQDYQGSLWAVGLRLAGARAGHIEQALADRSIVRTWPMRGTLHFIAAADARWVIDLLAPKVVARAKRRFHELGLDGSTIARARRVLAKRLVGGKAVARPAVYAALEGARISTAGQRGIHILWRLAQECFLCFGPREAKQHTFALFDAWLPRAKGLPREEALAELACRYFTGHGPAGIADFAWWSGLSRSDARLAIHLAGRRLEEETVAGRAVWFRQSNAPLPVQQSRARLLPAFDEFVVGYADRSAVLDPAHAKRVNAGGGILKPVMVFDGQVVGLWQRRFARDRVVFAPAPFVPLAKMKVRALGAEFERYAHFLGVQAG